MTGLTRASIAASVAALAVWAVAFFSPVWSDSMFETAVVVSVLSVALGVLARSKSASGKVSPWPRWMTAVLILLILVSGLIVVAFVVITVGLRGEHH